MAGRQREEITWQAGSQSSARSGEVLAGLLTRQADNAASGLCQTVLQLLPLGLVPKPSCIHQLVQDVSESDHAAGHQGLAAHIHPAGTCKMLFNFSHCKDNCSAGREVGSKARLLLASQSCSGRRV